MKNEIIREYENNDFIIYKRIGKKEQHIPLYFLEAKGEDKNNAFVEFRDIRWVRAFIKSYYAD